MQLLARDSALRTVKIRKALQIIARRLTSDDSTFSGNGATEIAAFAGRLRCPNSLVWEPGDRPKNPL